jgi:hypothetical protein
LSMTVRSWMYKQVFLLIMKFIQCIFDGLQNVYPHLLHRLVASRDAQLGVRGLCDFTHHCKLTLCIYDLFVKVDG